MTPADVALGEIGWAVIRGGLYSVAFLVTMTAMGMPASPWIIFALPFSLLIAFAFASTGMAITTYMRSWVDFEYVTAATLPLFLFSATFYPVSSYGSGPGSSSSARCTTASPSMRSANTGEFGWATLGHIAVLVAMTVVGLLVAAKRIRTLLLK